MFVALLFIPVVTGNVFTENSSKRVPEISERYTPPKTYMLFDPCNKKKPGNRIVSCSHLTRTGDNESTHYFITNYNVFYVNCDMHTDGGGWTSIQRRSWAELEDNSFEKSYSEYEEGFESSSGTSYWIGNKNIHALTTHPNNEQVLRVELKKKSGETIIVYYGTFKVGSSKEGYKLTIGDYRSPNGTDYNALEHHNGATFLTANGTYHEDLCARSRISGGWWFPVNGCMQSNLNGRKFKEGDPQGTKGFGITWYKQGDKRSYQNVYERVEMKIRDADYKFCAGKMVK